MVYNKTSEERKWNYWKEQEEKKLRELGMEEEKIQYSPIRVKSIQLYHNALKKSIRIAYK